MADHENEVLPVSSILISSDYLQNASEFAGLYEVYLPKRDSLSSVVPMTVLYSVIFFTGIVGNICTCIVIIRKKHMHTTTNCYLFSLAVSDLLLLIVGMPQEMYQLWNRFPYVFGEVFCVLRGLASETSTNVSILTIMSFTVERYLAVSRPIRSQMSSNIPRAIKIIIAVWIVGALSAAPLAFQFGVVKRYFGGRELEGTDECTLKRKLPHAFEISTFFFFVLPMCAISILYALISVKLFKTNHAFGGDSSVTYGNGSPNSRPGSIKNTILVNRQSNRSIQSGKGARTIASRGAAVKLLFAVVVAFFICWAPFHAQRLMALHLDTESTESEVLAYTVLYYVSGVTYFVSSTINPILYSIMSLKFRRAFRETLPSSFLLCGCLKKKPVSPSTKYGFLPYRYEGIRLVNRKNGAQN